MKTGSIIGIVACILALCGVVFAFLMNASPYVTVAEAKSTRGDRLHLAGVITAGSIVSSTTPARATFELTDDKGDKINVVYNKLAPPNLGEATRVVAIGKVEGEQFVAEDLLLKCPSKYEAEQNKP